MANVLSHEKRLRVLAALLDGNSVRATSRMTGVHQDTISRFALAAGHGAQNLHNRIVRGLSCHLLEVDELYSICGARQVNVTAEHPAGFGAVWIWVAVDAVSRMVITWHAGKRDQASADAFMADVRARLTVMPQITSDGLANYKSAIGRSFNPGVDYGQLVKTWDTSNEESEQKGSRDRRRKGKKESPEHDQPRREPLLVRRAVFGAPDLKSTTTAHVERNNLSMRHMNGRLRRKCLAFSKRPENHTAALALTYAWFNLGRVQRGKKVTPAMDAGVTDHIWDYEEFLTAVMTAEPCAPPEKQPLTPRVPETPHRELPGGRGYIRLVGGGKGGSAPATPVPTPLSPPAPVADPVAAPSGATAAGEAWEQLDLFSRKSKLRDTIQLALFDLEV